MVARPGTAVDHVVEFVAGTERRRLIVVLGVPLGFVALLEWTANYGVVVLLLAVVLAGLLYTRSTAGETIAASAYATGVVLVGLFLFELYRSGATGSTEPLIDTTTRVLWQAVTGASLIGLGLWLRRRQC